MTRSRTGLGQTRFVRGAVTLRLFSAPQPVKETERAKLREGHLLSIMLVALYVVYAALGRDIFFNPLTTNTLNDPISENLIYFRTIGAGLIIVMTLLHLGPARALGLVRPELLPFIVFALLSIAWSPLPKDTSRAAILLLLLYTALCMVMRRLSPAGTLRVLLNVIAPVVILSTVLALALPSVGVHNATDAVQGSHAGRWRGIFSHKNALGPWAAYGLVLLTTQYRLLNWPRWYLWAAILSSALCLANSNSATAVVAAVVMIAMHFMLKLAGRMRRAPFALTMIFVSGVSAAVIHYGWAAMLQLLGRDETLSGRWEIWPIVLEYIRGHLLIGSGYNTIGGPGFFAVTYKAFGAALGPENAYLVMLMDLGVVGFVLFFGCIAITLWRGLDYVRSPDPDEARAARAFFMILAATLVMGLTEGTPYICSGYTGIITYTALVGLLSIPAQSRVSSSNAAASLPSRRRRQTSRGAD